MVMVTAGKHTHRMDGYLKQNLDIAKDLNKKDWDNIWLVDGDEGCISKNSIIRYMKDGYFKEKKIKTLFKDFNKNKKNITYQVRSFNGKEIVFNRLLRVFKRGKKRVHLLTLDNGRKIKTTRDHKFLTRDGWKELKDLNVGEEIMIEQIALLKNYYFNEPSFSRIKSVSYSGYEDTYDLECIHPHYNFVANGIVVHNSGKSVMAMQMAHYLDSTIDINRICFTPQEFKKAINDAKPEQAVIFDEAFTGLSSRATMSFINRMLVNRLAEIRQKRLFIFIVAPTFFDIDRYVAVWRTRCLIHVYAPAMKRGSFMFFNEEKKKLLYTLGKKYYSYAKPKSNFVGNFPHYYPIDEKAYRLKKYESLKDKDSTTPKMKWFEQRNSLIRVLFELGWKVPQITEGINKYIEKPLTTRAIYRITGGRTDFEAEL